MSGYTKLFSSIIHSTIWRESKETKIVWITMLAMVNKKGEVEASIPGLAYAADVSIDECKSALKDLMSTDEYSRSKEYDGRRIEEIDGGWLVLNYAKYREKMSDDKIREQAALRMQRMREKRKKNINPPAELRSELRNVTKSDACYDIASASADAEIFLPLPAASLDDAAPCGKPCFEDLSSGLDPESGSLSATTVSNLVRDVNDDIDEEQEARIQRDCLGINPLDDRNDENDGNEIKQKKPRKKRSDAGTAKIKDPTVGSLVWEAYREAYLANPRYGVEPVRNARVNSFCAQIGARLGREEAQDVVRYYLTLRNSWYVTRGHSLQCLVADCEKVRTEWVTRQQITQAGAREDDRLKNQGDAWLNSIAKYCEPDGDKND